ncbi:MAG: prepilin-type N-terminal cleavage/methylation domain-containing protein [Candidatus Eisenbacteria bacterium]|nr:prepilin-type N-terminal cleavage/methylation domain-containing protein [Candidatus Eisenbacteria bacterium]MCC7143364.1 prepilin-type N-terminal cleavage/methylation domain-containing protein [Candidatus Eisenbacteria bacterium]
MRSTPDGHTSRRRSGAPGFSLIEMIVVIAVMAIVASIAIPMVDMGLSRERSAATMAEMNGLRDALLAYHEDHLAFPDSLSTLVGGGYIAARFQDSDVWTDAWGGDYEYAPSGVTASLRSLAADRTDADPNLDLTVSGTPTLRLRTVADLETIHRALAGYESRRLAETLPPLPALWWDAANPGNSAMGLLITYGQLENSTRFATDAWGDAYAYTGTPGDRVTSSNVPTPGGS